MNLQKLSQMLLQQVTWLIEECEKKKLTNEQWFIEMEDELNKLSIKDHNT